MTAADLVRDAELQARAALEARDPDAWTLVRAATHRRRMTQSIDPDDNGDA